MLCPNCGRNVNRGDRVCGHCGTRLPYEKMSDLEAAPPLSFLKGEQRGSGTEALQNAVNSQTQRIRELASEVEFLRTWEARSYGKIKRVLCMSIVSLVLCLLLVVISFVLAGSVKQDTSRQLDEKASELSVLIENKIEEIERKLNVLIEKSEQVQLRFEQMSEPTTTPPTMPTFTGMSSSTRSPFRTTMRETFPRCTSSLTFSTMVCTLFSFIVYAPFRTVRVLLSDCIIASVFKKM